MIQVKTCEPYENHISNQINIIDLFDVVTTNQNLKIPNFILEKNKF